jgi:transposase
VRFSATPQRAEYIRWGAENAARRGSEAFKSIYRFYDLEALDSSSPSPRGDAVGIDMGVVRIAALSNGTVVPPLNILKRYAADLRKARQSYFKENHIT